MRITIRWLLLLIFYVICFGAVSYFQFDRNYGNGAMESFLPAIVLPKISCGNFSCWEDTLRKIADNNSLIIVYAASIEYLDLTLNFYCNLKKLNVESNSVLVAMDEKMYAIAMDIGIPVLFDASFSDADDQSNSSCGNFRSTCFTKRTHLKTLIVVIILQSGFNILFSDVDVIWLRDPRERMWAMSAPGTLIIQVCFPSIFFTHLSSHTRARTHSHCCRLPTHVYTPAHTYIHTRTHTHTPTHAHTPTTDAHICRIHYPHFLFGRAMIPFRSLRPPK